MSEPTMHDFERQVREAQPDIGSGDVSQCLPGWINKFCDKHLKDEGFILNPSYTRNLLHTLIAARVRAERLVHERDAAIDQLKARSDQE